MKECQFCGLDLSSDHMSVWHGPMVLKRFCSSQCLEDFICTKMKKDADRAAALLWKIAKGEEQ